MMLYNTPNRGYIQHHAVYTIVGQPRAKLFYLFFQKSFREIINAKR